MGKVFVRKFTSKAGNACTALVVKYGDNKDMLFFDKAEKFMRLLDMKPSEFYELPNGDYEIK